MKRHILISLLVSLFLVMPAIAGNDFGYQPKTVAEVQDYALASAAADRAALAIFTADVNDFFDSEGARVGDAKTTNEAAMALAKKIADDAGKILGAFAPVDPNYTVDTGLVKPFTLGDLDAVKSAQAYQQELIDGRLTPYNSALIYIGDKKSSYMSEIEAVTAAIPTDQRIVDLAEQKAAELNLEAYRRATGTIEVPSVESVNVWPKLPVIEEPAEE